MSPTRKGDIASSGLLNKLAIEIADVVRAVAEEAGSTPSQDCASNEVGLLLDLIVDGHSRSNVPAIDVFPRHSHKQLDARDEAGRARA